MIILSNDTQDLQLVLGAPATTNQLQWTSAWQDVTTNCAGTPGQVQTSIYGSAQGYSDGTIPINLVAGPATPTNTTQQIQRFVQFISVLNTDTVTTQVIIFNSTGISVFKGSIPPGQQLYYNSQDNFRIFNGTGQQAIVSTGTSGFSGTSGYSGTSGLPGGTSGYSGFSGTGGLTGGTLLASYTAANSNALNVNTTFDQAIALVGGTTYIITDVVFCNPSIALNNAADGRMYQGTFRSGNQLVTEIGMPTVLQAPGNFENTNTSQQTLPLSDCQYVYLGQGDSFKPGINSCTSPIYFSLGTAEGTAATIDCYVFGYIENQVPGPTGSSGYSGVSGYSGHSGYSGVSGFSGSVAGSAWSLTGNTGTTPGTDFVGTNDAVGLMFKVGGAQAGYIDVVHSNTSFGQSSLPVNTTGNSNVAVGEAALFGNTVGYNNVAIGVQALETNTSGFYNVAIGPGALTNNTLGVGNIAIGTGAISPSLSQNTTGSQNVAVGLSSLASNITGTYLSALGNNTDVSTDGFTNATALGYAAMINSSNQIVFGNGSVIHYNFPNMPGPYFSNAAAISAGLNIGDLYLLSGATNSISIVV